MLELLINQEKDIKTIMLVENGILVEKHEEHKDEKRLEGNIYMRKSYERSSWNAICFY